MAKPVPLWIPRDTVRVANILGILTYTNAPDVLADVLAEPLEAALVRYQKSGRKVTGHLTRRNPMPNDRPRTAFTVDPETGQALRVLAELEDTTIADLVSELCDTALDARLQALGINPKAVRRTAQKKE